MKDHHPDTEPAQFKQDKTSGKQIRADRQAWLTLDARTAFAAMPDYSRYLDDDHEKLEEDFAGWISQHYWIVTQLFKEFLHAENNYPQSPQECGDKAADVEMLTTTLLENQKVLIILRDACTHDHTRRVLADLMDANTRVLSLAKGE